MAIFKTNSTPYRKISPGEKHFFFSPDGIKLVSRATIQINDNCPEHIRDTIALAWSRGYIQPVANMPDKEYMWQELTQNS